MGSEADSRIIDPDGFLAGKSGKSGESIGVINPAAVGAGNDSGTDDFARDDAGNVRRNKDGSPQRKRGRKAGSGTGARKATGTKSASDLKGLEKILLSVHLMAATVTKSPLMAIDEKEAALMANAIQSVQDFYDLSASAEVMLWVNVIGVFGAIYGPRIVAGVAQSKKKKTEKKEEAKSAPVDFSEGFTMPHHAPTE